MLRGVQKIAQGGAKKFSARFARGSQYFQICTPLNKFHKTPLDVSAEYTKIDSFAGAAWLGNSSLLPVRLPVGFYAFNATSSRQPQRILQRCHSVLGGSNAFPIFGPEVDASSDSVVTLR